MKRKSDRLNEEIHQLGSEIGQLQQAIRNYISECDNPVPDYNHRRVLRNRLRELADCPTEPAPRISPQSTGQSS